jgi:UDP-2-acetamido-3-amino-2,3-dideoxy-glucuronate N-acetyltransferase
LSRGVRERPRPGAPPVIHAPSVVLPGASIGLDAVVGAFSFVAAGAVIGAGTRIQSHVSVWDGVTLGEDVFVGPAATFTNVRRPRARFPRAPHWDPTFVEDGASIGANATIVAPVRIGRAALIGAGAVVTRDVPPPAVVIGAPARIVGWACTCGASIGNTAPPPKRAECTDCGRRYATDARGELREAP